MYLMKLRSRMTGTALVLALSTFGLAACGGDDDGDKKSDDSSQTDDSSTDDSSSDDSAEGKPSKDEVVDGYKKLAGEFAGENVPDELIEKIVTCFVDEIYDDASAGTLTAIAGGDQTGVDPDDASLFADATTACQQAALQ